MRERVPRQGIESKKRKKQLKRPLERNYDHLGDKVRIETITRNLYKYDELTEQQKQKALDRLYDLNTVCDWWEYIYSDAETVGCSIKEFDVGRGSFCALKLDKSGLDVAKLVKEHHGESCDTYKAAESYLVALEALKKATPDDEDLDSEDIDNDFRRALGECYLSMLRKEFEYLTSREAIEETIKANDYEFDENGKLA